MGLNLLSSEPFARAKADRKNGRINIETREKWKYKEPHMKLNRVDNNGASNYHLSMRALFDLRTEFVSLFVPMFVHLIF